MDTETAGLTLNEVIAELGDGNVNSPRFWEAVSYASDVLRALQGEDKAGANEMSMV